MLERGERFSDPVHGRARPYNRELADLLLRERRGALPGA